MKLNVQWLAYATIGVLYEIECSVAGLCCVFGSTCEVGKVGMNQSNMVPSSVDSRKSNLAYIDSNHQ